MLKPDRGIDSGRRLGPNFFSLACALSVASPADAEVSNRSRIADGSAVCHASTVWSSAWLTRLLTLRLLFISLAGAEDSPDRGAVSSACLDPLPLCPETIF